MLTPIFARRPLLAAVALGLLSALALPPLHAVPVLLLAIPGIMRLLDAVPPGLRAWRRSILLGFLFGWGHHVAGLYWVTHAILKDVEHFWWLVPLAAPALAVPVALFLAPALAWAANRPAGWRRWLALGAAWTLSEMARGVLFTGFPWNLIGTAWAFAALPVQGAALVGLQGLSLLTVLLAGLPLLPGWKPWAGGALALTALAGFGAWRLAQPEPPAPGVELVLVQGNIEQDLKWREDLRAEIFRRYLELTREGGAAAAAAAPGRRIAVLWPETASPYLLGQDANAQRAAAAALPPGALLLAGTIRADWDPAGRLREVFNSLVVLNPAAELLATYDKVHLVPFGEYMPLAGLLPIRLAAGGVDISPGPGLRTLAVPGLPPFGALICYEVIFAGAVTPAPRPEWLVNITNDAWFGLSAGPWQHLAAARLRAVEEGLPLARAAQTGISAVFDSRGRRTAMLPLGERGFVVADLPGAGPVTVFARYGPLIPGFISLFFLIVSHFPSARARRIPPASLLGRV